MEYIDGHPVIRHRVRFGDLTDISEADASAVRDGDTVVWLVQAECQPPSYQRTKSGGDERCRFNVQKVIRATVLTGELAQAAVAHLDHPGADQGYLSFTAPYFDGELHDPLADVDGDNICGACNGPLNEAGVCEHGHRSIQNSEEVPLPPNLDDATTEVVGTIYRSGHRGETQRLLEQAWGQP